MTPLPIATLESEIIGNPVFVGILVSVLFGALIVTGRLFIRSFEARLTDKLEDLATHNHRQDGRLDVIEHELIKYEKHVAVGELEIAATNASVANVMAILKEHMEKEEAITWAKIDRINSSLSAMALHNETAHGSLSARLASVEAKMPNGELAKLADAYHDLAIRTSKSRDLDEYARLAELDRNNIGPKRKIKLSKKVTAKKT